MSTKRRGNIGAMIIKWIYKSIRTILFSLTLIVVGIYLLAYILLAIPAFTNWVKDQATLQLSEFLGTKVSIEDFAIYPFNEAKITGLQVYDLEGQRCLYVETLGAGIRLWKLITEKQIDLTFGEIIGLEANIKQNNQGEPFNIDFIIKAFSREEKQEKNPFELSLKSVVLRKSKISLQRPWLAGKRLGDFNLDAINVEDLAADISFPKISDKEVEVDLRRLSLSIPGYIKINNLGMKGSFGQGGIDVIDFMLELPQSKLAVSEISIPLKDGESFKDALSYNQHEIIIDKGYFTPSEFSFLFPPLSSFTEKMNLDLSARGNLNQIIIDKLDFGNPDILSLVLRASISDYSDFKNLRAEISGLDLEIKKIVFSRLENTLSQMPVVVRDLFNEIGDLNLKADLNGDMKTESINGNVSLSTNLATINWEGRIEKHNSLMIEGQGDVAFENLKLNEYLPDSPIGTITANISAKGNFSNGNIDGTVNLEVDNFEFKSKKYDGLTLNITKESGSINAALDMNNALANVAAHFSGDISSDYKEGKLDLDLENLDLSEFMDMKDFKDFLISGNLNLDARGKSIDDLVGNLSLNNFSFRSPDGKRNLNLETLTASASLSDSIHTFSLSSDWADIRAEGIFKFKELPLQIKDLAAGIFPSYFNAESHLLQSYRSSLEFDMLIKKDNSLISFFNLPVKMLVPINVEGSLDGVANTASFTIDIPYLQQGKDKLIYDSRLVAEIDGNTGSLNGLITTTLPIKKGDLALNVNLFGQNDVISSDIHWLNTENSNFKGLISLDTHFIKNEFTQKPEIKTEIQPSVMRMGPQEWNIAKSTITFCNKEVEVEGLKVWHDTEFVEIDGKASDDYQDVMRISLADIDVDYIFGMLQINYVTFGGVATGEIYGRSLFSGNPVAETEGLLIKQFTYNGADLGECVASSRWKNDLKKIEIGADITKNGKRIVKGEGGIWLGKDSLSFDIHAMKAPVEFVQPFMSVFSSSVTGHASGDVKLFGTFHDIDMTGKVFADSVAVKLDFTNTFYHGSDSVIFNPGSIEIPHFRLYDKFGNSGLLTGVVKHVYFHEPTFNFRLSEAHNLLCYDTNQELNPDWYGTLFGSGSALVRGVPGLVDIGADMTVGGDSKFTFVLNDTQYAQDYPFLTFSNKKKIIEVNKEERKADDDIRAMFKKSMQSEESAPSQFGIDIRATITPQALFTLVMDPAAGDKITARGRGAMQIKYESGTDEMTMYGKYEIDEGNYNFSLQEIILRDFKIKDGSSISFNGNPLAADLDISATYRVNTNLSDLDKSFSTDRDLNRTNVPVDAVLSVNGNMQHPDITFDIELPTLTQDVERKVKSIISTDDMMNRQIIYLLALNRFYTPEYMGSGSNGGELAAVASSTISSQLTNILGQLTDKFSVAPSFRSDKGDFSDIEVDVALSSKLLNNRLLINGNFGYRDRSNSSTTFVGDFDVEYLLSKNGNLRLKAYNHFNDQNYYLREALTTQGLGVVYRKDFDDMFKFLRRPQKMIKSTEGFKEDSIVSYPEKQPDITP